MAERLFPNSEAIHVQAIHVGQRLELQTFKDVEHLSDAPLTIRAGTGGIAVVFRYGVVVFFDLRPSEVVAFLEDIRSAVIQPFAVVERDETQVIHDPRKAEGAAQGALHVHAFTLERLQIIADVLAKSVVLGHYEVGLAQQFDRIDPLAASLSGKRFGFGTRARDLLQHIGETLTIEGKMVGRVEVTEKPELIWDYPEHERLYQRLEAEYELAERHAGIERKLALISRTAETALSILQNQRSLRVEWYIVILIVVEILITLIDKVA